MQKFHPDQPFYCLNTLCIKLSLFLAFILVLSLEVRSQELIYENFDVDDGLPSSEVYDVYQDKEGYIWFATDKGISRYNGYEFENFDTSDGLTGNVVLRFYPQENGQIWCYSFHTQSLFYFNEKFDGFKPYKYNKTLHEYFSTKSVVKSVRLDKEGNLHIGGPEINGELIISQDGKVEELHATNTFHTDSIRKKDIILKPTSDSSTPISYFFTFDTTLDKSNLFWEKHITPRILVRWLIKNEVALFMNAFDIKLKIKNGEELILKSERPPLGIEVIDENHFFAGYQLGGAKIINQKGAVLSEYLKDESVSSFLIDHEGGYWFTTLSTGVYYAKNPSVITNSTNNSKSLEVHSLAKTKNNELLVGYVNGAISTITANGEVLTLEDPEITNHALVEYDTHLDKMYLYTNNKLMDGNKNEIHESYFIKLSEPFNKTIIASNQNGFYLIKENNEYLYHYAPYRVLDACIWNNDTLLATPLGLFEYRNKTYTSLSKKSHLFDFRSDDVDINHKSDILYTATHGAGVVIHDRNRIFNLTEKDGLTSNIVEEVYLENDTTLWACTNRGINRITWGRQGIRIESMTKKDGLLGNEVNDIEIINDIVWIGTKQGLCSFPKSELESKKITLPDLMLKAVLVNNNPQNSFDKTYFTYHENTIDIVLEGIGYAYNEDIEYKYRLNKNQDWNSRNWSIAWSRLPVPVTSELPTQPR